MANMDKVQLAPSGDPDDDENEELSDLEDVEDEII